MNIKHLSKTCLLVATIAMSISACKKEELREYNYDELWFKRPYQALPPGEKIWAFLRREFKLKSIFKNNIDVTKTFTPKEQLDNTFYFYFVSKVAYSFGAENNKELKFPTGDPYKYSPSRFSQYAKYELRENGVGYLTLANYLLDSGELGLIEFEVLKFEKNELILRRIENGATIDRVFSVSEELEEKPEIYNH